MNSLILATGVRFLFWMMLAFSFFVLVRGHNDPGGGFIAGLFAASAFAVYAFACGTKAARRRLTLHPIAMIGLGLLLALCSGLPGLLIATAPFLTHLWTSVEAGPMAVKLGTTHLFDLGVYLVVLGGVSAFFFALVEEPR